jgi:TIR domain
MRIFISHNKADKANARLIATLLVSQGENVWFDSWELQPGDSIAGGIEEGLGQADTFLLLWSREASKSNWVGAEYRGFLQRRMNDTGLRIIPVGLDGTPFPILVADYQGFFLTPETSIGEIVLEITGNRGDVEIAQILQAKLNHMMRLDKSHGDPLPWIVCPICSGANLNRSCQSNDRTTILIVECADCGWQQWTE